MRHVEPPVILLSQPLPEGGDARVTAAAPGARLVTPADLDADPGLIEQVTVAYPHLHRELWARATRLSWLQVEFAGADSILALPEARAHAAVITNVHIHGQCIAEHLWGMALMLTRNLHRAVVEQARGAWRDEPLRDGIATLAGKTLCVAGMGVIGARLAEVGRVLGMKVLGISRNARPHPAADEVVGPGERRAAFARSRVIMLVLPGTPETAGFVGPGELDAMQGAFLLNAGRGSAIDTDALVTALGSGRVRGAGLDVTDPEPLPQGHPLWSLPNVVITPHYAGVHPGYREEALEVFCGNLARWVAGEPLRNVVDKAAGY